MKAVVVKGQRCYNSEIILTSSHYIDIFMVSCIIPTLILCVFVVLKMSLGSCSTYLNLATIVAQILPSCDDCAKYSRYVSEMLPKRDYHAKYLAQSLKFAKSCNIIANILANFLPRAIIFGSV